MKGDLSDYGIEAKWIRTPGHTEGSISIVFPGQTAIVGDLVVGGSILPGSRHTPCG